MAGHTRKQKKPVVKKSTAKKPVAKKPVTRKPVKKATARIQSIGTKAY